jgi:ribosomal protein S21
MGVKVVVREGEPVASALRRLKKLMQRQRATPRPIRRKGPFRWMFHTKEYFQKPSLLQRIKRVRKQKYSRKATPSSLP